MDYIDAVRALTGAGRGGTVSLATGVATADSSDGKVKVDFGGVTVSPSGGQSVTVPTTAAVKAGDTVQVNLNGADGTGKTPLVYGVVGGGDRVLSEMRDTASGLESKITQNAESVTIAITTANGAKQDAATAASDAATAKTDASTAVTTANTASANASNAVSTANTAGATATTAKATADDAYARTLRIEISSAPADAAGDTSTLTETVWRGGERLDSDAVAKLGEIAWYVHGSRVATGDEWTCAAGTAVECRLEA